MSKPSVASRRCRGRPRCGPHSRHDGQTGEGVGHVIEFIGHEVALPIGRSGKPPRQPPRRSRESGLPAGWPIGTTKEGPWLVAFSSSTTRPRSAPCCGPISRRTGSTYPRRRRRRRTPPDDDHARSPPGPRPARRRAAGPRRARGPAPRSGPTRTSSSSSSPPGPRRSTSSSVSGSAPTTTSPSPSARGRSWPESRRCCGDVAMTPCRLVVARRDRGPPLRRADHRRGPPRGLGGDGRLPLSTLEFDLLLALAQSPGGSSRGPSCSRRSGATTSTATSGSSTCTSGACARPWATTRPPRGSSGRCAGSATSSSSSPSEALGEPSRRAPRRLARARRASRCSCDVHHRARSWPRRSSTRACA